ncbi:MAG: coagulation factor 5/8 type domain protein [Verrucomicrobia bacterium]|nr:coagulation factor 5/8 type domain protein [Verrucomicrobiota bacterium]
MKLALRWWCVAALWVTMAAGETALTPFKAIHFPYEPGAPLLNEPGYGDQLRGAKVTASAYDDEQRPEFVKDGITNDTVMFWTSKVFPSWVRLDLPEPREIAQVNLHLRGPGTRVYHFTLEGSEDGTTWQALHDQSTGSALIREAGLEMVLDHPVRVRALRLTFLGSSKPDEGPYVCEIVGLARPDDHSLAGIPGELEQYNAGNLPLQAPPWSRAAWRGERVHAQFVFRASAERLGLRMTVSPFRDAAGHELPRSAVTTRFVRQVLADGKLVGDVLDDAERVDMPEGSYRVGWLTVETPRDAVPGIYHATLTARADATEPKSFPLTLEVLPATLPAPPDWKFHLDIWQHPWSIARMHGVKPWSDEHFQVMRPYMVELARAGQKVITTTITPRPWGRRDYDDYGTMVDHLRQPDGSWTFDYAKFDRYVEFAMSCGITQQINCYAMLTWSGRMEYTDAATGDLRTAMCEPGTSEYADYWGPFLQDFQKHLEKKGWLEKTRLGVDEAPAEMMKAMMDVVRVNAPRIKAALAGNHEPSHYVGLDLADFTIILDHASDDLIRDIAKRRSEGRVTTFYVCLDPKRPNTFVSSPYSEAVWIGYYASVNGYDGMARWAVSTWPENPLNETLYSCHPWRRDLPPGDEFLLYPGPRASVHWEMLRDGIEENEKLRWLRDHNGGKLPSAVADALESFRDPKKLGDDENVRQQVGKMRAVIEQAARETK